MRGSPLSRKSDILDFFSCSASPLSNHRPLQPVHWSMTIWPCSTSTVRSVITALHLGQSILFSLLHTCYWDHLHYGDQGFPPTAAGRPFTSLEMRHWRRSTAAFYKITWRYTNAP